MIRVLPIFFLAFLVSCGGKPSHDMTEQEIDQYIESCLDTAKIYEIAQGLRFSRDDETYQVTEYSQYDTVILYNVAEASQTDQVNINMFFKDDMPIYLEEYRYEFSGESTSIIERKVYFTGSDILKAYERSTENEGDIELEKFEESDNIGFSDYDFSRPKRAIDQEGEFEMKYGEFLIINPESYLILENDKSKYGVALYILEGDMLLDELFAKPEAYRGKTIFVHHEFLTMNGIERMIYRGGIVKEN